MWIRGQKKLGLLNCDYFEISTCEDEYCITNGSVILGGYSTKEKALKVLDMIQSRIIHKEENLLHSQYQEPIIVNTNDIVFQMPADEEVEV